MAPIEYQNRKLFRNIGLGIMLAALLLACRTFSPTEAKQNDETYSDNVCYSEQQLTDEECNNAGTHEYSSSISLEGIGGTDCATDDGSTYIESYHTYTFTFLDGDRLEYAHPGEQVWDASSHTFSEVDKNTYEFTGSNEGMHQNWKVTYHSWGFDERLKLTWDCANGTCGCITTGVYNIVD